LIAILDYGVGNLKNVEKALRFIGADCRITQDRGEIMGAEGLVVPGVGSFDAGMRKMNELGFADALREAHAAGKHFLGICLGMQFLYEYSEEGSEPGLGLIKGGVLRLPAKDGFKIPHMGWDDIESSSPDMAPADKYYFLHSYYGHAEDKGVVRATCDYAVRIDAAVRTKNFVGLQFHPEKSGAAGLEILRIWVRGLS
jgi:glutamine amidotransferase